MIETIRQGLADEGVTVSMSQRCRWCEISRRTVYYRPHKAPPVVQPRFAAPIKAMIDQEPSYGYRTVAHLLGFNKNTVQRVFQLRGWQVKKRPVGFRPRVQSMPSVATAPNTRWATDLCRVWAGRDGWVTLALVIDCHTRTPHCPEQNGMVERVIRTIKEQCVHRHRFETLQHASRVLAAWIQFYNTRRPHQALAMKTPAEAFALAA